nr:uncharacterized protein LOC111418733 [Onthophagus taurus]
MALKKTFIFIFLTFAGYETKSESIEFKWKFTLDADDAANFVEDKSDLNCKGFYFPDFKDICMMSLHKLTTNEIFLPKSGDIYLKEGAEIIFDPTNERCIKVKSTSYKNFLDPNSWTSKRSGNRAVPDLERTPCHCDEVTFPNNSLFAMKSPSFLHHVKKIDYGLKLNDYSCPLIISTIDQRISSIGFCEDDKICQMRQHSSRVLNELCPLINRNEEIECSEGIELLGHCGKFCGGVIRVKSDFYVTPSNILPFLNENFDVYSSKIIQNDDFIIQQISITDKGGFNGESAMKLVENAEKIERLSKKIGVESIQISISGPPSNNGGLKNNVLIVFCTLIFVVGVFGVIFGVFEKNYFNLGSLRWDWINQRANLARYNQALRRSVIFSRFDDNENVSIAGSVLNLQREEFDNPLYTEGDNQDEAENKEGEES